MCSSLDLGPQEKNHDKSNIDICIVTPSEEDKIALLIESIA
jgi:hypothetical protein